MSVVGLLNILVGLLIVARLRRLVRMLGWRGLAREVRNLV